MSAYEGVDTIGGVADMEIMLLPLLPLEAPIPGIDIGEELAVVARKLFEKTPFHTKFIQVDL